MSEEQNEELTREDMEQILSETLYNKPEVELPPPSVEMEVEAEPVQEEVQDDSAIRLAEEQGVSIDEARHAIDTGYNPNYDGPNKKSVQEFNRTGQLIEKLDRVADENYQLRESMKFLTDRMQEKEKAAYDKALKDIASQRAEAVAEGDIERFTSLDEEFLKMQEESMQLNQQQLADQNKIQIAVNEFEMRNSTWYNDNNFDNAKLMNEAREYEGYLAAKFPEMPVEERLKKTEIEIRNRHPSHDAFKNYNREVPAAVTTATRERPRGKAGQYSINDLGERERMAYKMLVKLKGKDYTVDDYIKEIL